MGLFTGLLPLFSSEESNATFLLISKGAPSLPCDVGWPLFAWERERFLSVSVSYFGTATFSIDSGLVAQVKMAGRTGNFSARRAEEK